MRNTSIAYTSSNVDKICSEGEIQAFLGPFNLCQTEKCSRKYVYGLRAQGLQVTNTAYLQ